MMDITNDLIALVHQLRFVCEEAKHCARQLKETGARSAEQKSRVRLAQANLIQANQMVQATCRCLGLDASDLSCAAGTPAVAESLRQKVQKEMEHLALNDRFNDYITLFLSGLPENCSSQQMFDERFLPVLTKLEEIRGQVQLLLDAPEDPEQAEAAKSYLEALAADYGPVTSKPAEQIAVEEILCAQLTAQEAEACIKRAQELLQGNQ